MFAALWVNLGRRNLDPSAPAKFALGLILMGVGFLVMFLAARYVVAGDKVLPTWLILTYLLHTFGELCLSPVGLSSMTKLAPARFVGQVMGVWFLATAVGNNLAGQFSGEIDPNNLPAMPGAVHVPVLVGRDRRRRAAGADAVHQEDDGRREVSVGTRATASIRLDHLACGSLPPSLLCSPSSGCDRKAPKAPASRRRNRRCNSSRASIAKWPSRPRTGAAGFAYATYINPDTEFLNAKANERYLEYFSKAVEQAKALRERAAEPGHGARAFSC